MLRRDSIMQHVARTGHMRCRAAGEIRPETDCKVRALDFLRLIYFLLHFQAVSYFNSPSVLINAVLFLSFSIPPILRMGT